MNEVIGDWNGKEIAVAINNAGSLHLTGTARNISPSGILLEIGGQLHFIPATAIAQVIGPHQTKK